MASLSSSRRPRWPQRRCVAGDLPASAVREHDAVWVREDEDAVWVREDEDAVWVREDEDAVWVREDEDSLAVVIRIVAVSPRSGVSVAEQRTLPAKWHPW
jgi:hypothetical protein